MWLCVCVKLLTLCLWGCCFKRKEWVLYPFFAFDATSHRCNVAIWRRRSRTRIVWMDLKTWTKTLSLTLHRLPGHILQSKFPLVENQSCFLCFSGRKRRGTVTWGESHSLVRRSFNCVHRITLWRQTYLDLCVSICVALWRHVTTICNVVYVIDFLKSSLWRQTYSRKLYRNVHDAIR